MPPAPEPFHLLIADAAPPRLEGDPIPALPPLPTLDALLTHMRQADIIEADDDCPATPFEMALARAHRLPGAPGRVPWAAFESGIAGTPCAWFKPCHWQLGMGHAQLIESAALALTEDESRALLAAVRPLLAEDGVTLTRTRPDAWLAQGELLRGLSAWSMRRAQQQTLAPEMLAQAPTPTQNAHLRRLQAELQMLLHDHPVNEARERARRYPVNALWIDGAGALEALLPPDPHVEVESRLADLPPEASLEQFHAAWRAIDGGSLARLRRVLDGGGDARLTLCGPRRAITCAPARGLGARISRIVKPLRFQNLYQQL